MQTIAATESPDPSFSIIIPVYQEAKNIPLLVKRLAAIDFPSTSFETILVDDNSQDRSLEIVNELKLQYPWLKLIVRKQERSWSKSILQGIQEAQYSNLVFMDADLSHPPENIPQMLALLAQAQTDLVIGSRHINGGRVDEKWPFYRKLISRAATWVIKPLLPCKISDPLSGFIAFRKKAYAINGNLWNPIGTKLGLEVIVKSKARNIVEIPIYFEERKFGESKLLNWKSAINYAKQVQQLWGFKLSRK
jgi:dolichol-phosphate mannosyltransferase